jgi:hypothetical protein
MILWQPLVLATHPLQFVIPAKAESAKAGTQ